MSIEDVNEQIARAAVHAGAELIPSVKDITAGSGIVIDDMDPEHPVITLANTNVQLNVVPSTFDFNNPIGQELVPAIEAGVNRVLAGFIIRGIGGDLTLLEDGSVTLALNGVTFATVAAVIAFVPIGTDFKSAFFPIGSFDTASPVIQNVGVEADTITATFDGTSKNVTAAIDFLFYDVSA